MQLNPAFWADDALLRCRSLEYPQAVGFSAARSNASLGEIRDAPATERHG